MSDHQSFHYIIDKRLNLDEFRVLCQDLNVEYDNLAGGTKINKIISLVGLVGQERIIDALKRSRPDIDWPIEFNKSTIQATLTRREREILLNRVHNGWIKGVLKKSIHKRAKMELGLEYEFNLQGHVAERQNVEFGKEIGEIFDEAGRQLLILGEPGSGKTTTLLMLAEDLLKRAKENANEPIPLILNLSTWTAINSNKPTPRKRWLQFGKHKADPRNQKPFERWLGQACFAQYSLNPEITLNMLKNQELVLMLDALDEVGTEKIMECLQAINKVGLNELVVSSRVKDYGAIETNLHITTGVQILPLTDKQINAYFANDHFTLLKNIVKADMELKELARIPLMLSVMALAFEQASEAELKELHTVTSKVDFIFSKYVDEMFEQRPTENDLWDETQAHRWLASLADILEKNNQTEFTLNNLNIDWLKLNRWSAGKFKLILGRIIFSLLIGLIFGLLSGLLFNESGLLIALAIGLMSSLISGLLVDNDKVIGLLLYKLILEETQYLPNERKPLESCLVNMQNLHLVKSIGGNWRFIHKSLQEHFASKSPIIWEEDHFK